MHIPIHLWNTIETDAHGCLPMLFIALDCILCIPELIAHIANYSKQPELKCRWVKFLQNVTPIRGSVIEQLALQWAVNWISCVFRCFVRLKSSNSYFNWCVCISCDLCVYVCLTFVSKLTRKLRMSQQHMICTWICMWQTEN